MMRYYQKLVEYPVFGFEDVCRITGNENAAAKAVTRMIGDGFLHRIKKDLYTCVNLATGYDCASRFQIASRVTENSFVSGHTAFEFYASYNQVYYTVQVFSLKRFKEFDYDDYHYEFFPASSDIQVSMIQGIRIATIERSIIDSINLLGRVMDAEELVKCLDLIHNADEKKLFEMLEAYDKEILYRKAGYVLSFYKDDLNISDDFFKRCREKGVLSNKGSLIPGEKESLEFISQWGLYGYKNLRKLSYKGGN